MPDGQQALCTLPEPQVISSLSACVDIQLEPGQQSYEKICYFKFS